MRKILLLVTDLQIGGTPTVVRELARRLHAPPQVSVEVACLAPPGPVSEQLQATGIRTFALHAKSPADLRVLWRLCGLLRQNSYDTVLSFLIHANAAAATIAPLFPRTRFIQSIQTTQPNPRWHWALQSLVQLAPDRIVVPSPSVAQAARQWSHLPVSKLCIIPNAVDPAHFLPTGKAPLDSIGFIGRLDPIKRVPDLIEATRLLPPTIHLHIFGEGPERSQIESMIKQRLLNARVTLHGTIVDPPDALRQISVLVLPSLAEGFGLVLIEAMAGGVPIVATNVPGIRDVVQHERTGLLVRPRHSSDLAKAIQWLLTDRALRQSLIENAREDVSRRFSWDVVLPQYKRLLGLPEA